MKQRNIKLRKEKEEVECGYTKERDEHLKLLKKYSEIQEKYANSKKKISKLENELQSLEYSNCPLEEYNELAEKYRILKEKNKALENKHGSDDEEEKSEKMCRSQKGERTRKRINNINMESLVEPEAVEINIDEYQLEYPSDDTRNIQVEEEKQADKISVSSQTIKVAVPKIPRVPKRIQEPKPKKIRKLKKYKDEN